MKRVQKFVSENPSYIFVFGGTFYFFWVVIAVFRYKFIDEIEAIDDDYIKIEHDVGNFFFSDLFVGGFFV